MIHLKCYLLDCVRNGDTGEQAENLRQLFRIGGRYTVESAWDQWQTLCKKWDYPIKKICLLAFSNV